MDPFETKLSDSVHVSVYNSKTKLVRHIIDKRQYGFSCHSTVYSEDTGIIMVKDPHSGCKNFNKVY